MLLFYSKDAAGPAVLFERVGLCRLLWWQASEAADLCTCVPDWWTVELWVSAARSSSATARWKGCDCHNPHPRAIDALGQQPWEWPFRSLPNPCFKWFLRGSQCTINLSSLTPPKCQAGKDMTSSSILRPNYPKRLKWRLWKTATSPRSSPVAFRTKKPQSLRCLKGGHGG